MDYTVHIGWTSSRPLKPDEHWSSVTVTDVKNYREAELVALQIVSCRSQCEMVTTAIVVV